MRIILSVIFSLIMFISGVQSQSIQVSALPATASNNMDQFPIAGHIVNISGDNISNVNQNVQSSSINRLTSLAGVLNTENVAVLEGAGERLYSSSSFSMQRDDSSVKIYAKANGGYIIRENIANFLFFDSWGEIEQSISNSSQSTEGESVSELAADPAFKTVVIYNPTIVRNGQEGSRARIVNNNFTTTTIFSSSNREIRKVNVTEDGQYIGIVNYQNGSNDHFLMFDKFGNEIANISFDQSIEDAVISETGKYVTLRSNGRVGVYSVLTGERIGSTSFRSRLIYADFMEEDQTIMALTADKSGSTLNNVEFHAINIEERSVERQEYSAQLSSTELLSLDLKREGAYRYLLTGLNKSLRIQVQF